MLTLYRTRSGGSLTFSCCLTRGGAITDRSNGRRFSRQRRVRYGAVNLALLLSQRVVQIALNLDALLSLRLSGSLALGWVRRNWRQRNVLLLGVSLAVAAVPEGLPAILSVVDD